MNLKSKSEKLLHEIENLITEEMKPVTIVDVISTKALELFTKESDTNYNQIVQNAYIQFLTNKGVSVTKADQSWRVASGGSFEGYIRNHINETLNENGIVAIKGSDLKKGKNQNIREIIKFLMLPNKRRCTQTELKVWADNDVIVLTKTTNGNWRVLAVISCKTSDHSRNTSVLFWSLAYTQIGVKYILATKDRDNQFSQECRTANKKQRLLFEAYCDRVYSSNPLTKYCSQVRSLIARKDGSSELTEELLEIQQLLGDSISDKVNVGDL